MRTINQIKILSDILHNKELLVTIENIGKENVLFREGILYPGDRLKKFTCDCEQAETVDLFHLSKEKKYDISVRAVDALLNYPRSNTRA